jgi:dimeric dUTPase (all-alpha-NTP-PPase superfamily)
VYFVGRFATAQSNWRIEDSIFVAKRGFLLSEVIKEQKRFNEALEVRLPRGVEREQDLLLHLFSEVAELQRELRWKRNRPKRKDRVKTTSVLEESVDCVKVILSILEGHSITERALMEAFEKKNRVVWLRFVEEFYGV